MLVLNVIWVTRAYESSQLAAEQILNLLNASHQLILYINELCIILNCIKQDFLCIYNYLTLGLGTNYSLILKDLSFFVLRMALNLCKISTYLLIKEVVFKTLKV